MYLYSADVQEEDSRTQLRRRLQQQRCLVCGARQLALGHGYFCIHCKPDWRFCSTCEQLRPAIDHGKDSRCKGCSNAKATAEYHAHYRDATIYRIRLKQISTRQHTRGDQIFVHMRRRIALAELVRRSEHASWPQRAAMVGGDPTYMAEQYRRQVQGRFFDADHPDQGKRKRR